MDKITKPLSHANRIVEDLLEKPLSRQQRIELLRQLVRSGEDVPDELLNGALQKLMERLAD